jgi:hypothetical protein
VSFFPQYHHKPYVFSKRAKNVGILLINRTFPAQATKLINTNRLIMLKFSEKIRS